MFPLLSEYLLLSSLILIQLYTCTHTLDHIHMELVSILIRNRVQTFQFELSVKNTLSKEIIQLGVGSHVSNPNTQEAEGERSTWDTY